MPPEEPYREDFVLPQGTLLPTCSASWGLGSEVTISNNIDLDSDTRSGNFRIIQEEEGFPSANPEERYSRHSYTFDDVSVQVSQNDDMKPFRKVMLNVAKRLPSEPDPHYRRKWNISFCWGAVDFSQENGKPMVWGTFQAACCLFTLYDVVENDVVRKATEADIPYCAGAIFVAIASEKQKMNITPEQDLTELNVAFRIGEYETKVIHRDHSRREKTVQRVRKKDPERHYTIRWYKRVHASNTPGSWRGHVSPLV
ncbi:hypothetical protein GGR57DRAFT_513239 [Xylariaceae sp. FL1272]|nr:hypothetical protein GGR57DRAFT_513239 [Xylariaceae sp. FL1272]